MKKLAIYGLGETSRMAFEFFTHDSDYNIECFIIDEEFKNIDNFNNFKVLSTNKFIKNYKNTEIEVFVALGSGCLNYARTYYFKKFKDLGYKLASYVNSKCSIWHDVEIGQNCFIQEDNCIQSKVKISDNVLIWSKSHIGHKSFISENCFIASNVSISGYCNIGSNSTISINVGINNHINIGKNTFINSGEIIKKNIPNDVFISGNQNREIAPLKFFKVPDKFIS